MPDFDGKRDCSIKAKSDEKGTGYNRGKGI